MSIKWFAIRSKAIIVWIGKGSQCPMFSSKVHWRLEMNANFDLGNNKIILKQELASRQTIDYTDLISKGQLIILNHSTSILTAVMMISCPVRCCQISVILAFYVSRITFNNVNNVFSKIKNQRTNYYKANSSYAVSQLLLFPQYLEVMEYDKFVRSYCSQISHISSVRHLRLC